MAQPVSRPRIIRKRERRSSDHKPEVILDFLFDRGLFFIAIENIGDAPALKVSTKFDRIIMGVGGSQEISSLPLFQNIEFLAPHKPIVMFLDTSTAYFRRGEPTKVTVQISFWDSNRRHNHTTIHHDLGIYEDIGYLCWSQDETRLPYFNRNKNRKEE